MASYLPAASAERHALNSRRFDALLLASASIVWWTNAAGEFVEEQPYWQAYTGQTWDEYKGSRWTSCLHPDDRDSIVGDWTKAVTSGGPYFTQGRIWNVRYGTYRAFQMRGIAIRNVRDEIVEWLGALTDVQDTIDFKSLLRDARKDLAETLQALRISEARSRTQAGQLRALSVELRATLNTAGIGIARCSRDLRYLNANETYATITGFPLSEIIGRPIVEVMGEAALAAILPYIERVLTDERVEYETVIPYQKGMPNAFFRVVNVPDRDPKGSVIGWIACVADITASRQAELALAERNAQLALAERNAQLALVGRAALVGCYAFDVNKDEIQISEGYAVIHGLPEGTTETTRREWQDRLHPEDIGRLDGLRGLAFNDRRGEYNVEYRIVLPNRGVRWIEARSFISYDGDGNAQRVVGVDIDVTDRKQTELALQASEAKFAGILAIAGDAIVSIDASHRITLFNEAAEKVFGYSRAEALGQPIDLLIPTRFRAEHQRRINHFASGPDIARRVSERQEVVGLRKNGEEFPAEASISKLDVGGERFYTVVMRDITDRKRAELALAERNAQLALAGRAALVGSYAYDVATETVQISEGYAAIFGFPEGTTELGRSEWLAKVHPEDFERAENLRNQVFRERRGEYNVEYRIVLPNRGVRWIEARSFISYNSDGSAHRVIGVNIDVTERRRTEQILTDRNRQLELAAKHALVGRYAIEIDVGQEDFSLHRLQFSPGFAAIYGLSEETTEITLGHWRSLVHPDDLPQFLKHRQQLFAERRSDHHAEHRIVRPCGTIRWIEARSFIEYDQAGHAKRMVGVNIDITERKRAEEARKVLNAELDHRVKNALATVTAVISHTRQGSRSVAEFAAALEGRIRSMAATQELLSARRWQGISLTELVRSELAPYATSNNTKINGPEVILKLEAGQPVAMVLHELATNAAKYGALSSKEGCVSIQWDLRQNGHATHLVLEWKEIGGPPVVASDRSSFGMSTICDLIPHEFGGTVDLTLDLDGVRCRVELPAQWFSKDEPVSEAIARAPRKTATKLDRS